MRYIIFIHILCASLHGTSVWRIFRFRVANILVLLHISLFLFVTNNWIRTFEWYYTTVFWLERQTKGICGMYSAHNSYNMSVSLIIVIELDVTHVDVLSTNRHNIVYQHSQPHSHSRTIVPLIYSSLIAIYFLEPDFYNHSFCEEIPLSLFPKYCST